jgi:glycosyltransferase involved in cell wall biosynthesis
MNDVLSREEDLQWMARYEPMHGVEDSIQNLAAKTLVTFRKKQKIGLLDRKIRGIAYRAFASRFNRQLEIALHSKKITSKFVYHSPLTTPLPHNLPKYCVPVVSIYDIIPLVFSDSYPDSTRLNFRKTIDSIQHHNAHIIVNSEDTKHSLICYFNIPASRIHVVQLGSDIKQTTEIGTIAANITEPFALYVAGSNQRRKNLTNTVLGFRKFTEITGNSAQLVIAGGGTDHFQEEAHRLTRDSNAKIICLGAVDDSTLSTLYRQAKIGLYTSLYEGYGLPILECMAQGLPIICGNRSSLAEAAGGAAILVEACDPNSIAAGIANLWQNEAMRKTMSERGLIRANEMSWDASAKALFRCYDAILGA